VLKLHELMKKNLFLIATVVLVFCACERHPAGQLPTEAAGRANEQSGKATGNEEKQATPAASPSGTPKTYFPQNS
jgi:hypothetical protein